MALFPKRQAILISAAATTRAAAIGRGAGGAAMSSMAFVSQAPHRRQYHQTVGSAPASARRPPSIQTIQPSSTSTRYLSSSSGDTTSIELPNKTGDRNGLIRHEIIADDGHPLRLYSRAPRDGTHAMNGASKRSILLLHGRTWSSQPVFDLRTSPTDEKQQSTLQSLSDLGFHVYALDLRGFGETPRDYDADGNGGYTTPRRCVSDTKCAIDWITDRHEVEDSTSADNDTLSTSVPGFEDPTVINTRPALLGWSQGALVAQMYAQKYGPSTLSDLILFGSIFDPKVIYPRKPLYDPSGRLLVSLGGGQEVFKSPAPEVLNTDIASLEDFTLPGTICDEAALTFSSLALGVDTIKGAWDNLHEFNVCNPALVHIPSLVIVGAQDPYVSWDAQRELYDRMGTEDKQMCILPGCDHAAHILKARKMFVRSVAGFLLRKDAF